MVSCLEALKFVVKARFSCKSATISKYCLTIGSIIISNKEKSGKKIET